LPGPAEDWLRVSIRRTFAELRRFFSTAWSCGTRPYTFAAEWAKGIRDAPNPLGFAATGVGIYWALSGALAALLPAPGEDHDGGLFSQFSSSIGPYLQYALLGAFMHAGMRVAGSRQPLVASLGVALFAGATVGTAFSPLLILIGRLVARASGSSDLALGQDRGASVILLLALAAYFFLCVVLARAMQAIHLVPGWRAAMALLLAVLATALTFGNLIPEGTWGWHPWFEISRDNVFFGFSE
jgi:hypothetical protein